MAKPRRLCVRTNGKTDPTDLVPDRGMGVGALSSLCCVFRCTREESSIRGFNQNKEHAHREIPAFLFWLLTAKRNVFPKKIFTQVRRSSETGQVRSSSHMRNDIAFRTFCLHAQTSIKLHVGRSSFLAYSLCYKIEETLILYLPCNPVLQNS